MYTFVTQAHVHGLSARAAYEFTLKAGDEDFQAWWPGTHLRCRRLRNHVAHVGSIIHYDQHIGPFRVRETAVIVEVVPHQRIMRQVIRFVRVPVWITFDFEGTDTGVIITHTLHAGLSGIGRILDPIFRLIFSRRFIKALDAHLLEEFELMRNAAAVFAERDRNLASEHSR